MTAAGTLMMQAEITICWTTSGGKTRMSSAISAYVVQFGNGRRFTSRYIRTSVLAAS